MTLAVTVAGMLVTFASLGLNFAAIERSSKLATQVEKVTLVTACVGATMFFTGFVILGIAASR